VVPDFRDLESGDQSVLLRDAVAKAVFIFGAHQFHQEGQCWPRRLLAPTCTFPKPDDPTARAGVRVAASRDQYHRLLRHYLTYWDPSLSTASIVSELRHCFTEVQELTLCFKSRNGVKIGSVSTDDVTGNGGIAFISSFQDLSEDNMLPPKKAFSQRNTKVDDEVDSSDVIFLEEINKSHPTRLSRYEGPAGASWPMTRDERRLERHHTPPHYRSVIDHDYLRHPSPSLNCLVTLGRPSVPTTHNPEIIPLPVDHRPARDYRSTNSKTCAPTPAKMGNLPVSSPKNPATVCIPISRSENSLQSPQHSTNTQYRDGDHPHRAPRGVGAMMDQSTINITQPPDQRADHLAYTLRPTSWRTPSRHDVTHPTLHHSAAGLTHPHKEILCRLNPHAPPTLLRGDRVIHLSQLSSLPQWREGDYWCRGGDAHQWDEGVDARDEATGACHWGVDPGHWERNILTNHSGRQELQQNHYPIEDHPLQRGSAPSLPPLTPSPMGTMGQDSSRVDDQVLQAVEGILPTRLVKHLAARLRPHPSS
ncbi:hypothetical protein Hamer_G010498, partial [Homarus americanus]